LLAKTFAIVIALYGTAFGIGNRIQTPNPEVTDQTIVISSTPRQVPTFVADRVDKSGAVEPQRPVIQFRHGQVDHWLTPLALEAGWLPEHIPTLRAIILRESGGCPNLRGGDVPSETCEILRVREWNHRSDTGLLQINGVNYNLKRNKWARVCLDMGICEQEPLLDPLTNLKAGKLLYDYSGWNPWNPCTYGDAYAHLCKRTKKATP
jgi:hypothetical protein